MGGWAHYSVYKEKRVEINALVMHQCIVPNIDSFNILTLERAILRKFLSNFVCSKGLRICKVVSDLEPGVNYFALTGRSCDNCHAYSSGITCCQELASNLPKKH